MTPQLSDYDRETLELVDVAGDVVVGRVRAVIEARDKLAEEKAVAHAEITRQHGIILQLDQRLRDLTSRLGFGDGITEPQADNDTIIEWYERESSEAAEWRESQAWRTDCALAGHPDDEDCPEHDPSLILAAAVVARDKADAEAAKLRTIASAYYECVFEFCCARSPQSTNSRWDLCRLPDEHAGDHIFGDWDFAAAVGGSSSGPVPA